MESGRDRRMEGFGGFRAWSLAEMWREANARSNTIHKHSEGLIKKSSTSYRIYSEDCNQTRNGCPWRRQILYRNMNPWTTLKRELQKKTEIFIFCQNIFFFSESFEEMTLKCSEKVKHSQVEVPIQTWFFCMTMLYKNSRGQKKMRHFDIGISNKKYAFDSGMSHLGTENGCLMYCEYGVWFCSREVFLAGREKEQTRWRKGIASKFGDHVTRLRVAWKDHWEEHAHSRVYLQATRRIVDGTDSSVFCRGWMAGVGTHIGNNRRKNWTGPAIFGAEIWEVSEKREAVFGRNSGKLRRFDGSKKLEDYGTLLAELRGSSYQNDWAAISYRSYV